MIVNAMRLSEEVKLRQLIRTLIQETRVKVNKGWEGYEQGLDADNSDIDAGYDAHYYEQYANVTMGQDHTAELDSGGENVITRRLDRRGRTQ